MCTGTQELDGEVWSVEMQMIEPYRHDMLGFFEEIAANAESGWSGVKRWESEYAEMHIDALNDGRGVVDLDVLMRWPPTYAPERLGSMTVETGDLPRLAEEMRRFLRLPRGHRFRRVS